MYVIESRTIKIKSDDPRVTEDLITTSIEKTLIKNDVKAYELVRDDLYKHRWDFEYCYKHPEYLGHILKEHFGNNAQTIVELISKDLYNNYNVQIFLDKLLRSVHA